MAMASLLTAGGRRRAIGVGAMGLIVGVVRLATSLLSTTLIDPVRYQTFIIPERSHAPKAFLRRVSPTIHTNFDAAPPSRA
jgi:hypothetical protein